ncbi:MAG: DUF1318 domain-containing protein [Candidatus Aminicenantes bacterium]|nr:DUF1318 domain-containing protein [Candidatus Aminicenantes bacterium]
MRLKALKFASISLSFLFLLSCLTINIYFPEAEVQKTADEIVKEIRKSEEEKKEEKKNVSDVGEAQKILTDRGSSFSLVPAAYAQEEVEVSTPKIRALKQSLKERFPKLRPFFDKGSIGETNDGFIQIRDESGLNLKEKALLRNLEKEENSDRRNLYSEVANALDVDPSQIGRVHKIFAQRWIKEAKAGWWIQKEDGGWVKKT